MNQLNLLQALGWALLNSLWQMALLWLIYQLITGLLPKLKARYKASTAVAFTLLGFTWFIITFISSLFSPGNQTIYSSGSGLINPSLRNQLFQEILPVVSFIYLAVLVVPVWRFIRNYRYVQIIRTQGLKKMDAGWRIFVKNTAASMGIARKVQIWLSELVTSPVTIGYLKPVILVPVAAINNLTPQQLEAIILHELNHIHRYDYFFNLVISFIRTILYFNPFVSLLAKSIERERENSCDEMVLQHQYKPTEYASALLRLEVNTRRQMMVAAAGNEHVLLHRIESILGIQRKAHYSFRRFAFASAAFITVAVLNILFTLKNDKEPNNFFVLQNEVSPYYFFNNKPGNTGNNSFLKINESFTQQDKIVQFNIGERVNDYFSETPVLSPGFQHAGYQAPVIPELTEEAEVNVKEAVNATRKILEEKEWKELEKSYAEVFNPAEKAKLKNEYLNELKKINWETLENKLKLSYDQIDWNSVNEQINASLAQIKFDSIQQQLTLSLANLFSIENTMRENETECIPDTDITLKLVKENQLKAKQQLEKLKAARPKKIVRI